MGVEIERKFRVDGIRWRREVQETTRIAQGYLNTDPDRTVRVRTRNETGRLTIKGRAQNLVRPEFEYEIPVEEARRLLEDFCPGLVDKERHEVVVGDHRWEIDEFFGANEGLILAEIELSDPDEDFRRPTWLGEEVTGDERFYNARLVENPYRRWSST